MALWRSFGIVKRCEWRLPVGILVDGILVDGMCGMMSSRAACLVNCLCPWPSSRSSFRSLG